jgi:hypothetical protein
MSDDYSDDGFDQLMFDSSIASDNFDKGAADNSSELKRSAKGHSSEEKNDADDEYGEDFELSSPHRSLSSKSVRYQEESIGGDIESKVESAAWRERPSTASMAGSEGSKGKSILEVDTSNPRPSSAAPKLESSMQFDNTIDIEPSLDGSKSPFRGRDRLEYILRTLHDDKTPVKMHMYTTTFRDKITPHKKIISEGTCFSPTSTLGLSMTHARVKDYRQFRPTSSDKKVHPRLPRQPTPVVPLGVDFRPQEFRSILEKNSKNALSKIESMDSRWNKRLHQIRDKKVNKLRSLHKEEMANLYIQFNSFKDNDRFLDTMKSNSTLEQKDYVEHHAAVQRMNNHSRREKLTSLIRNRQNDEIRDLKNTMRAPLEVLKRTSDAQVEVVETTVRKVIRALDHIQKMIAVCKSIQDPVVRLRSQKTELNQLDIVRWTIHTIEELSDGCEALYDKAFIDYDEEARKRISEIEDRSRSRSRSASPNRNTSNMHGSIPSVEGKFDEHSSPYTRKCYYRQVNGYKYRTQSPPRGSTKSQLNIPGETRRPHSSSLLRGHVVRGQKDIFNEKNRIPYRGTQLGKGGAIPGKSITRQFPDLRRPSTAPEASTGPPSSGRAKKTTQLPSKSLNNQKRQPKTVESRRPRTATSPTGHKNVDNKRPKSCAASQSGGEGWDPNVIPDGEDDDASVGIIADDENYEDEPEFLHEEKVDFDRHKANKRHFLDSKIDERTQKEKKNHEKMIKAHQPKVKANLDDGRVRCSQCTQVYEIEKTIFTPKYGVHPTLQAQFRAKQAAAQRKYLQAKQAELNVTEQQTKRLIKKMNKTKRNFGVSAPKGPDQFCSWVCCKIHTLRNCHASMKYDMEVLITLTAGQPVDTGGEFD